MVSWAPPRPSSRTTSRSHVPCWAQETDGPRGLRVLGHVGQELGHAEVGDGLDGRASVASRRSTESSVGTALRAASVASAPSSPMSSAGGWMPRAMSRSSAMASLAPRCASSTSSRTRSRSTSSASSSFSLAMPSRMASATSWAWVPSCRSRSIRRSVAAEASTVWVRACSSVRTRAAIGSGPSSAADEQAVDVDEAAHDPGCREEEDDAEEEDGEAVEEALAVEHEEVPGEQVRHQAPDGGPASVRAREGAEEAGERVPPQAERDEDAEHGPGHLEGEVADGPPADPVAQGRLQPPEEAVPADERLGVLDLLAEHGAGQARAASRRCPGRCGWRAPRMARPKNVMASTTPVTMVTPTKARPSAGERRPRPGRSASSAQGRLVKGSRRMRRATALAAVSCSSLTASDISRPPRRTRTSLSSACSTIMRPARPSSAAPTVSATAA